MKETQMQSQDSPPQPNPFILEEYRQCYESKKHYDNLSWTIAAVTLALVGPLVAFLATREIYTSTIPLRVLGTVLVWFWFSVYERNRLWADVANERARDIERVLATNGLAIQFMIANRNNKVTLKNVDSSGVGEEKPRDTTPCVLSLKMHNSIRILMGILFVAVWVVGL